MATEIVMPSVSTSITEGTLARWMKNEGDAVTKGEVIAEIETDKASLDVEAEAEGLLVKQYVQGGTTVKVGAVLGIIAKAGEMLADHHPSPQPSRRALEAQDGSNGAAFAPTLGGKNGHKDGARVLASPVARNLALLHGFDLASLKGGSGPNGRIVKRDVEDALNSRKAMAVVPAIEENPRAAQVLLPAGYVEIPHTPMRRVIAQRLTESKHDIPHFYLTIDCQLDRLLSLRQEINSSLQDAKISVNDFIIKAAAGALKQVPAANVSWTDAAIRRYTAVDISVAVATPNGLITPIVRHADRKSIGAIAAEMRDLAGRARKGKLLPEEYQGGGFSISNLGMYGIREFAAIINPPQACILAIGSAEKRAVFEGDAVVPETIMTCTLSVDHRAVDGAVGAEFLAAFKALLANPLTLLL